MSQSTSSSALSMTKGEDPAEKFVEYSILAGDYDSAAETLESTSQTKAAKTVKFVQLAGGFPNTKVSERHKAVNYQDPDAPSPVPLFELGPQHQELKKFTNSEAERKFAQGEPLISAATHLSLGDVKCTI